MNSRDGALKIVARGEREIVMTRSFDATRALVFDAWTRPELLRRWLGVRGGWSMVGCDVDLRVGGAYRFAWRRDPDGKDMAASGVYREIVAPERLVYTETFDDPWYPGESLITTVLSERGGKTTVTSAMRYDSRDARDAVLRSPMERGVAEGFDKLAELLASAGSTADPEAR